MHDLHQRSSESDTGYWLEWCMGEKGTEKM